RGHQRCRSDTQMAALLKEARVPLADLIRGHRADDLRASAGLGGDGAVTDDELARVQASDLAGRGALGGAGELDADRGMAARVEGGVEAAVKAPPMRAYPHAVDAARLAVERHAADGQAAGEQAPTRADGDRVGARVRLEHIQRFGRADTQTMALADRVDMCAAMLAQHHPLLVDYWAGPHAEAAVTLEEIALARASEEAQVL